jgi:hypothetical protein
VSCNRMYSVCGFINLKPGLGLTSKKQFPPSGCVFSRGVATLRAMRAARYFRRRPRWASSRAKLPKRVRILSLHGGGVRTTMRPSPYGFVGHPVRRLRPQPPNGTDPGPELGTKLTDLNGEGSNFSLASFITLVFLSGKRKGVRCCRLRREDLGRAKGTIRGCKLVHCRRKRRNKELTWIC